VGWQWRPINGTKDYEFFWSARQDVHIEKIKQERAKMECEKENARYRRLIEIYQGKFRPRQPTKKSSKTKRQGFF
jgi:hypothetical protein